MPALCHYDGAIIVLLARRYLAQEGRGRGINHIVVVLHLGVKQAPQEEDSHRYQQAYQQAHQRGAALVGSHGRAVDARRVEHLTVGLDGGLADHQLLATAQQMEVQVLLDFRHTLQTLDVKLLLRHAAHLRACHVRRDLCFGDALLQHADIHVEQRVHVVLQGVQLSHLLLHHWVVLALVFLQLEHQRIVLGDKLRDVLVVDTHIVGYQVSLIALVCLYQVARRGELLVQALFLFRTLYARRKIRLAVRRNVEQTVLALEVGQGVLLHAEIALQQLQTLVDEVVCVGYDALLVLDGVVVIDAYGLVDDLGGAYGRSVLQHNRDDGVKVVVAEHLHGGTVIVGHSVHAAMLHMQRLPHEGRRHEPGGMHHDAAKRHSHSVFALHLHRLVTRLREGKRRRAVDHRIERHHVVLAVVYEVDLYRRLPVKVFHTVHYLGLGRIEHVEFQGTRHFQHRRLRREYHHLVVDVAVVQRPGGEHALDRSLADGAVVVAARRRPLDEHPRRALVHMVLVAHPITGDKGTYGGAEYQPVKVAQHYKHNILDVKFRTLLALVEERHIVVFAVCHLSLSVFVHCLIERYGRQQRRHRK